MPWNGSIRVPVTPFAPQISSVDDLLTNDDRYRLRSLRLHLDNHRGYYWRAILLAPIELSALRGLLLDGEPLLDLVGNATPLTTSRVLRKWSPKESPAQMGFPSEFS